MSRGALVLSLDFEMAWAYRRGPTLDPRDAAMLSGTREIVPRLLAILDRYKLPATWATVGNLMVRPSDCTGGRLVYDWPAPQFQWYQGTSWYDGIPAIGDDGADLFYAPDLVEKIIQCGTYQELATHTLTHIFVGEAGCSEATARGEFNACQRLARNYGRTLRSVVFPRNFAAHLNVLEETGYQCYRGLNSEWYWFGCDWNKAPKPLRAMIQPLRYVDEKWPLCPPVPTPRRIGKLWEIPHSMFFPAFRGISKYVSADDRTRRARLGLRRAAEAGRIFSLWTHPENLLQGTEPLLTAFDEICREAADLRDAGKIEVLPMEQVVDRLNADADTWSRS